MKNNFIKNPFNYTGSKDRILPLIQENIPTGCTNMVDLFGGSGVVSVNLANKFTYIYYNDKNKYLCNILEVFKNHKPQSILDNIYAEINFYNLNKSNKEGFLKLRDNFNEFGYKGLNSNNSGIKFMSYCQLLTLVYHSFNYFWTFNKNGQYVNTSGANRCYFNPSLKKKLEVYIKELHSLSNKIFISNDSFDSYIDWYINNSSPEDLKETFIFIDSPYSLSDDSYSRTNGLQWTKEDDIKLFSLMDKLNSLGVKFMLVNQVNKGNKINKELINWSKKYTVIDTNVDFHNCNYQRKNKGYDKEVLIKNY